MGMYLRGKEPNCCGACPCFHAENPMYCQAVMAAEQKPRIVHPYAEGRPEWCPIIKLPDHLDLVILKDVYFALSDYFIRRMDVNHVVSNDIHYALKDIPIILPKQEEEYDD